MAKFNREQFENTLVKKLDDHFNRTAQGQESLYQYRRKNKSKEIAWLNRNEVPRFKQYVIDALPRQLTYAGSSHPLSEHDIMVRRKELMENGQFHLTLSFRPSSIWRPSLWSEAYGGIDNIVDLFTTGYPTDGRGEINRVVGYWHTLLIASRTWRDPDTSFVDAIERYNALTSTFGGSDMEVSSTYNMDVRGWGGYSAKPASKWPKGVVAKAGKDYRGQYSKGNYARRVLGIKFKR